MIKNNCHIDAVILFTNSLAPVGKSELFEIIAWIQSNRQRCAKG
ncbi:Hypothetical protein LUCI_1871 [Lucifera butyrica]|uniref:Uncharacterized protein n=1 Tax=Lucifera butyrica TaxID=1351585 RepID=A0A498R6F1_9FIRM|nr:Hypothetical protein LUCI_1871 [Lucifera butyrica]